MKTAVVILAIFLGAIATIGALHLVKSRETRLAQPAACPECPKRPARDDKRVAKLRDQLRTAGEKLRAAEEKLQAANDKIRRLRRDLRQLNTVEKRAYSLDSENAILRAETQRLKLNARHERRSEKDRIRERIQDRTAGLERQNGVLRTGLATVLHGAFHQPGFRGRYQGIPRRTYPWTGLRYGDLRVCVSRPRPGGQANRVGYRIPIELAEGAVSEIGQPAEDASVPCGNITFGFMGF